MILIFSIAGDPSTNEVIKWLNFYKSPYIRINSNQILSLKKIAIRNDSNDCCILQNESTNQIIDINQVSIIWYRKGFFKLKPYLLKNLLISTLQDDINNYCDNENRAIFKYIMKILRRKKCLNYFYKNEVNKLEVLNMAKLIGLKIPDTLVTTSKSDLDPNISLISKSIYEALECEIDNKRFVAYTSKIDHEKLNSNFFPSLFQNRIDKEADIRVFYINGNTYAMAILSQEIEQTSTDFRKYSIDKPNKRVPIILPVNVKTKLNKLMESLELESGSIDLILDRNGEFIFLEVNPVGQYGMVGEPCNYYLHKLIAETLINYVEE